MAKGELVTALFRKDEDTTVEISSDLEVTYRLHQSGAGGYRTAQQPSRELHIRSRDPSQGDGALAFFVAGLALGGFVAWLLLDPDPLLVAISLLPAALLYAGTALALNTHRVVVDNRGVRKSFRPLPLVPSSALSMEDIAAVTGHKTETRVQAPDSPSPHVRRGFAVTVRDSSGKQLRICSPNTHDIARTIANHVNFVLGREQTLQQWDELLPQDDDAA